LLLERILALVERGHGVAFNAGNNAIALQITCGLAYRW
jgi:hypothetical protein